MSAYYIPSTFTDEITILSGRLKLRSVIEAVVFSILPVFVAFSVVHGFKFKIFLSIALAGPFFCLGMAGIRGDYLSVAILTALRWLTKKSRKVYDASPRPYIVAPVDAIFADPETRDRILNSLDERKKRREEKRLSETLAASNDINFYADPTEVKYQQQGMVQIKEKIEKQRDDEVDIFASDMPDDLFT